MSRLVVVERLRDLSDLTIYDGDIHRSICDSLCQLPRNSLHLFPDGLYLEMIPHLSRGMLDVREPLVCGVVGLSEILEQRRKCWCAADRLQDPSAVLKQSLVDH